MMLVSEPRPASALGAALGACVASAARPIRLCLELDPDRFDLANVTPDPPRGAAAVRQTRPHLLAAKPAETRHLEAMRWGLSQTDWRDACNIRLQERSWPSVLPDQHHRPTSCNNGLPTGAGIVARTLARFARWMCVLCFDTLPQRALLGGCFSPMFMVVYARVSTQDGSLSQERPKAQGSGQIPTDRPCAVRSETGCC